MLGNILNSIGERISKILGDDQSYGVQSFSLSLNEAKRFLHYNSIASLLPYLSYDTDSEIFINKNSAGFILEMSPLTGSNEQVQMELVSLFENILPEGSNLQIMLIASNDIYNVVKKWEGARVRANAVLKALALNRAEYFKEKAAKSEVRSFKVIVSYSEYSPKLEYMEHERLISLKKQIIALLEGVGFVISVQTPGDLINTLDSIINVSSGEYQHPLKWNALDPISEQIIGKDTHLTLGKDGILVADSIIKTYNVKRYPNAWSLAAMLELIGDSKRDLLQIPCNFVIQLGVHIVKDNTLKSKMLAKALRLESQADNQFTRLIPSLADEVEEWRFTRYELDKGSRVVKTHYQVTLFTGQEEIERCESILLSLYRSQAWELVAANSTQLPGLLNIMPMIWGEGMVSDMSSFKRMKTTLSHEPVNLMPMLGEWKGTSTPGMMLAGRRGQIFYFYPFDNHTGNYNICVVGKSGSGKSVFMQELVTSTLGIGGRVFVLDVGRSFEKLAGFYNGKFIEFKASNPICLNPFSTILDRFSEEAVQNTLLMIKQTIAMMAAPIHGTDDMENSIIERAVFSSWDKHKQDAGVDSVVEELNMYDEQISKDLATKLYPFTTSGIYGSFFNGKAQLDFKEQLIVIEFEELRQKRDLQNVILQMVILQITNQMILGERQTLPFNIVIDEAWDMLKGGRSGDFIELLARTLRKFNGSLVVGTQSVDDFYLSKAAEAAFANSDWMCLLSQKPESIARLKDAKRLSMDVYMEGSLKSLNTKQGEYAEVMIYGMGGYAVGRLYLDEFSQLLYSTKAEDVSMINELKDKGYTVEEAINVIIKAKRYHMKTLKSLECLADKHKNFLLKLAGITLASIIFMNITSFDIGTGSLKYKYFISTDFIKPKKGDYAVIKGHATSYHAPLNIIKQIIGISGEVVEYKNKYIKLGNSQFQILDETKNHEQLTPITFSKFIIPDGYVFIAGDHERSFDSRYKQFGLVEVSKITGRAFAIW